MLQAEFVRDMHSNYLVLKGIEGKTTAYSTRMLLNNQIPGLLVTELRCIDQIDLFYYDITSKRPLTAFCEIKSLSYSELRKILSSILQVFEEFSNYLLSDNDFIMEPNYIFIDNDSFEIGLCHFPGYDRNIQKQLSSLMEYLMNKVDYKDEAAVVTIYAMYKESKEPDCTFESLLKVLNIKINETKAMTEGRDCKSTASQIKKEVITENQLIDIAKKDQDKNRQINKNKVNSNQNYSSKINKKDSNKKNNNKNKINSNPGGNDNNSQVNIGLRKKKQEAMKASSRQKEENQRKSLYKKIIESCFEKETSTGTRNVNGMPIEEVESEREYQYYSPSTYVKAGITAVVGVCIFICAVYFKLLHNDFGTHIDNTKLISFILIIGSIEAYIFIKLFDSKNKVTGIRTEVEELSEDDKDYLQITYLQEQNQEKDIEDNNRKANSTDANIWEKNHIPDTYDSMGLTIDRSTIEKSPVDRNPKGEIKSRIIYPDKDGVLEEEPTFLETVNEVKKKDFSESDEPTQIIWMNKTDSDTEATVILANLAPQKQYHLMSAVNEKKVEVPISKFPFIIGKLKKGVDYTIDDKSVSRRHARFTKVGEDIFITDLNSTNGTFLNGVKLQENKPYLLTDKDVISFSEVKYTWVENG